MASSPEGSCRVANLKRSLPATFQSRCCSRPAASSLMMSSWTGGEHHSLPPPPPPAPLRVLPFLGSCHLDDHPGPHLRCDFRLLISSPFLSLHSCLLLTFTSQFDVAFHRLPLGITFVCHLLAFTNNSHPISCFIMQRCTQQSMIISQPPFLQLPSSCKGAA